MALGMHLVKESIKKISSYSTVRGAVGGKITPE